MTDPGFCQNCISDTNPRKLSKWFGKRFWVCDACKVHANAIRFPPPPKIQPKPVISREIVLDTTPTMTQNVE